ncbi:MAG: hypothetical protein LH603_07455 [Pseudonocardia sp.]|nr:hypothetical protein [Pseudonocardia sp.]
MGNGQIRLRALARQRHWQKYETFSREFEKAARAVDPALSGSGPSRAQLHRWMSGQLKGLPYPDACRILEKMFEGETAGKLFERYVPEGAEREAARPDEFTGEIVQNIESGLTDPEATHASWGQRRSGPGRPAADRASADLQNVPFPERLARKVTGLGHVLRWPPDEIAEIASLAGQLVDLSLTVDLHIAADGICTVTYRYQSLNLTDRAVQRAPRDLWFQHSRGKLQLTALREGTTKNAIQRIHTADNMAKFACQLSPPIEPGEARVFGYTCTGAEFQKDWYWRQAFARYTREYTLRVRHVGLRECAGITATEELPDGTESLAQESVAWDYDGDDVIMTFTRDHLQPNQYATLRWEPV